MPPPLNRRSCLANPTPSKFKASNSELGPNKASELEALMKVSFPHAKFGSRGHDIEDVLADEPGLIENCQAIVCATGNWVSEAVLNSWHVAGASPPFVVYA